MPFTDVVTGAELALVSGRNSARQWAWRFWEVHALVTICVLQVVTAYLGSAYHFEGMQGCH